MGRNESLNMNTAEQDDSHRIFFSLHQMGQSALYTALSTPKHFRRVGSILGISRERDVSRQKVVLEIKLFLERKLFLNFWGGVF